MRRVPPAVGAASAVVAIGGLGGLYRAGFGSRSQLFGSFPYQGDTAEPVVALTFDDGPNEPWTSRLLDVLGEREVPGTFFQVGHCAQRHPDVTRRVLAEGHVLGNHSLSHSFGRSLGARHQAAEVTGGQQALQAVAGVTPLLYRPPWLCHWPWVLRSVTASGSTPVSGTFGSLLEVAQPAPARIATAAAGRASAGAILILHDGREARGGNRAASVGAVGPLVDRLRARGYRFTTVDRLLGVLAYA